MTKESFDRSIERLCGQYGAPELAPVLSGIYGMSDMLSSDLSRQSFVKAAERVIGYGDDRRRSLLRRLLPIAAMVAAGGGLLALGDAWGRTARDEGRTEGPFIGIPRWLYEKATGRHVAWVGKHSIKPNDEYHRRPLSADEYDNLMHHGRYEDL